MPVCSDCRRELGRKAFAKSQLKKPPEKRRCSECVEGEEACSLEYIDRKASARRVEAGAGKERLRPRFAVGDRVECNHSSSSQTDGFSPGTIVQLWYREESWTHVPKDFFCPYQIRLDNGYLICAPKDDDTFIRASDVPPPSCWICLCNDQSADNLIVRDCSCRGTSGYIHLECLTKFAITRTKAEIQSGNNEKINPFTHCTTCHLPFSVASSSSWALARACYETFPDEEETPWWHAFAVKNLACEMKHAGNYEFSMILLEKRAQELRTRIQFFRRAGYLAEVASDEILLARILSEIAGVYEKTSDLEQMKNSLDEACRLNKKNQNKVFSESYINHSYSRHADLSGNTELAMKYAELVLQGAREKCVLPDSDKEDELNLSCALNTIGGLCVKLRKYPEGIAFLEESLAIDRRLCGHQSEVVSSNIARIDEARQAWKASLNVDAFVEQN